MNVTIQIDDEQLKQLVMDRLASEVVKDIWGNDWDAEKKEKRQAILNKINWKEAGRHLSDTVVHKFFSKLLDKA